jgi:peptidylprolyl isomerase
MSIGKIAIGLTTLSLLGVWMITQMGSTSGDDATNVAQSPEIAAIDASNGTVVQPQTTMIQPPAPSNLGRPISDEERKKRVQTKDLVMGATKQAVSGSQVTFHILIKLKDGTVAIDSRKEAEPWKGVLGNGSMMSGLNEGLNGMFLGGKRAIWIPAHLAYGSGGIPGQIPPNSDLYAEVEMISVF